MIRNSKLPHWAISAAVLFPELCGILPAQTRPPIVLAQVPAGATFQTTGTAGYLFYAECSTDGQDWRFLPSMKLGNGSPVQWGFSTPEPGTPRQLYRIRVSATGGYTAATAATQDTDGDTIPDVKEVENSTNPISPDTDADGISDNQEAANGTSATRLDMPTFTIVTAWRRAAISKTLNNGSSNPTVSDWRVMLEEAEGAYNGYTTNTFSPSTSFPGPNSAWDPVDLLDTALYFWTTAGYTGVEPVTARNKAFRLWGHRYQQFTVDIVQDSYFGSYGEVLDRIVRVKASRPMPVDWRIPYVKVSAAQPGFTAAWTAPGGQQGNPPPTVESGFFTFTKGDDRSSGITLFVADDGPVPVWPSVTAFEPNRPGNAESRSIQVLYFTKFGTAISSGDKDGDGVTDALEKQMGLDPAKRNTDGTGYADGDQINQDVLPPVDGFRITTRVVDFNAKVSWKPGLTAPDKKEESLATITDLPAATKFQYAKDQTPVYDLNTALQDKITALSPFPETVPGNDQWPIPDPLVQTWYANPYDTTASIFYRNSTSYGTATGDQCRIWATIPEPLSVATTRSLVKIREETGASPTVSVTPVTLTIPAGATVSSTHVDLIAARPTTIPTGPLAAAHTMDVREKLLPVEFEVKHTEINPTTGQVVNLGANTMFRDEIVDIRIKIPTAGTANWTIDLSVEPEAMRNQNLSTRGNVQMYDFGQVENNGVVTPDKTQFILQSSAGGEGTIKAVFNKEGTLKIKMKSTDGKIDFTSPNYTIQKRMRKYASLPSSQNHDLNQHDKAFEDAATYWGGVYQHQIDDVERLKAMGMTESDLGITDAVDILTVGNNDDFVIPRLKGLTSGVRLNGTSETWTKEFEFLPNGSGGYIPSYYNYQDASKASAPIAIKWGTCWFYKKAMTSSLDSNAPPTYSKFDGWRTWESATTRYNGGGVNNYLERVNRAMREGKHPTTSNLYLWPVKSNKKARGNP